MSAESWCFSGFFFPVGLDPIDPQNPYKPLQRTELLRSQADPKWVERGQFPMFLTPNSHPTLAHRAGAGSRGHREVQAAGWLWLCYFFNLSFLQRNCTPAPALISWALCWDCPLLGQGELGSQRLAAGRAGTNEPTKSLLPTHGWPLPPSLPWWSLSETPFLMAPVISKAGLTFSLGKALCLLALLSPSCWKKCRGRVWCRGSPVTLQPAMPPAKFCSLHLEAAGWNHSHVSQVWKYYWFSW